MTTVGEAGRLDLGRQRHPDWHTGPNMRPYLRVANVFEDRIDTSDLKEMDFTGVFERYRLEPGDVLLNEGQTPELLGRPAIYRGTPEDVAFTNTLVRFRANEDILPEWSLLVFRAHMHSGRFKRESRITTNIAHLSLTRLRTVEFPVPPIEEQIRITQLLEEHLSQLSNSILLLDLATRRTKQLLRAVLQNLIPTGPSSNWREVSVEKAGNLMLGRPRHPDWHSGPEMRPYLRVANVFEDRIDTSDVKQMDFSGVFERYRLADGDVLLNEGQSPDLLGRPAIYRGDPPDTAFTNTLIRFQARPDVLPEWALLVFRRHMHSGRFAKESRITTNIAHLSLARLKNVEFPIPPVDEQRRIVQLAAERLSAIDRLRTEIAAMKRRESILRRELLRAAFSGRLTDNRTTEPAHV